MSERGIILTPSPPPCVADFDSATGMLRALSRYLHGEDFPLLGTLPRWTAPSMKLLATLINRLPRRLQEQIYIWSGWYEAITPEQLQEVNTEQVAAWMASLYPQRQYPAVMVGSSNGAAVHLCAALGIPWLPQTFLIPVARSGIPPDEPQADAEWAEKPARALLQKNPDIQLHHMHDPVQDRLMIQRMTYFRVKRLCLGAAYERFLQQALEPGGTIYLLECGLHWPTTRYGDRHFFQFGPSAGGERKLTLAETRTLYALLSPCSGRGEPIRAVGNNMLMEERGNAGEVGILHVLASRP